MMDTYGVSEHTYKEILKHKENKNYQVACVRLFEGSHTNGTSEGVGNHPNAFFNSSQHFHKDLIKETEKKKAEEKKDADVEMKSE